VQVLDIRSVSRERREEEKEEEKTREEKERKLKLVQKLETTSSGHISDPAEFQKFEHSYENF